MLDIYVTLRLESSLAACDSALLLVLWTSASLLKFPIFPFVKVVLMLTSLSQEKSDKCSGQMLAGPQSP